MTVKQLRGLLEGVPDNFVVVQSKDAEGNNFSPFSKLSLGEYRPITSWFGEFTNHSEDMHGSFIAVCLWPTN